MESYKWINNLVLINLYLLCLSTRSQNQDVLEGLEGLEDLEDLKVLEQDIYTMLDPSIRHHIQKLGISLKENTYIGFDTEFIKKDLELNEMVSAQLAVTTKTYVVIHKTNAYCISHIDETSNRVVKQQTSSIDLNYKKIEMSIQQVITAIRKLKYSQHDLSMLSLIESLKVIKGLEYTEQEDKIVFSLPRSIIQPYIHYGNTFSLKEIIQVSSGIAKDHQSKSYSVLMSLIRMISRSDITQIIGQENMESELIKRYSEYAEITALDSRYEDRLPLLSEVVEDIGEKRLSRKYLIDLFPQRVSVTRNKNYYLIAHLTPADLSLLSDFEEIKEDLSIVNGSFVTLGKPIKFYGRNVHIRDTMLLAPGPSKGLAAIGRLYGGELTKLEISKEDLEDMKGFLARDKERFTEYALRDAIISLIHAA